MRADRQDDREGLFVTARSGGARDVRRAQAGVDSGLVVPVGP